MSSGGLLGLLTNRLATGSAGPRLLILTYHRVLPEADELLQGDVDAATFDAQLKVLGGAFNVLRLDDAFTRLRAGTLPPRALSITFDDGYADNRTVALPILQRHGLAATFFIATGFLDGGRMWNDTIIESLRRAPGTSLDLAPLGLGKFDVSSLAARRTSTDAVINSLKHRDPVERQQRVDQLAKIVGSALPDDLMMTSQQVVELRDAGMLIGAHTTTHPVLTTVEDSVAEQDIAGGRARLRDLLGESIDHFAYPNGRPGRDYLPRHMDIVRKLGFKSAVSTAPGFADGKSDSWQLPRVSPWDPVPWRLQLRLMRAYRDPQQARA